MRMNRNRSKLSRSPWHSNLLYVQQFATGQVSKYVKDQQFVRQGNNSHAWQQCLRLSRLPTHPWMARAVVRKQHIRTSSFHVPLCDPRLQTAIVACVGIRNLTFRWWVKRFNKTVQQVKIMLESCSILAPVRGSLQG